MLLTSKVSIIIKSIIIGKTFISTLGQTAFETITQNQPTTKGKLKSLSRLDYLFSNFYPRTQVKIFILSHRLDLGD